MSAGRTRAEPPETPQPAALLAAYDEQLRGASELEGADDVRRHGPLWWATFDDGERGFCSYRDLAGADGAALEELIEATVAHFRDATAVADLEWKTRGHDPLVGLGVRLQAHGFVADELETVLIGAAEALAVEMPPPAGVVIRRAGDGAALLDDARRVLAQAAAVFGRDHGPRPERLAARLEQQADAVQLWLAEAGGEVVCSGRLERVPGTDFAGIWGGGTRPQWRGRGIYRALVAARARAAVAQGARFLHSDSSPMSAPILERMGLVRVTTTTPYVWTRP
ncbi:MAG: GNAT family N-acetyltransferase [Nocardioides sp.]